MKPEELVPDIELCGKLRELGMPQRAIFVWRPGPSGWFVDTMQHRNLLAIDDANNLENGVPFIAAPTVAELGEWLPNGLIEAEKNTMGEWRIAANVPNGLAVTNRSEANARAKLLIWCFENGYVRWTHEKASGEARPSGV